MVSIKLEIERALNYILATQKHQKTNNSDTNLFIDADLSILASPKYKEYQIAIREEYKRYSDKTFRDGRKKVIEYFYNRYESIARENLTRELKLFT
ncbi:MAG: hypothetical protein QM493_00165 [Sulfurovum sp.]